MADSNLDGAINALHARANLLIPTASPLELADITECLRRIRRSGDLPSEELVTTRVLELYSSATLNEKLQLSKAVSNMMERNFVVGIQFPDHTGKSDTLFKTNGMSTSWSKVTLSDMDLIDGDPDDGDILVYSHSSEKFVPTETTNVRFRNFANETLLPSNASAGEIVFIDDTQSFKFNFIESKTFNFSATLSAWKYNNQENPEIILHRNSNYTFTLDGTTTDGHPLYITTDNGSNFSTNKFVGEYTLGVTNSRAERSNLQFVVPASAPDVLYYQCGHHASLRGVIRIVDSWVDITESNEYD